VVAAGSRDRWSLELEVLGVAQEEGTHGNQKLECDQGPESGAVD
jgi:hypothetical protein